MHIPAVLACLSVCACTELSGLAEFDLTREATVDLPGGGAVVPLPGGLAFPGLTDLDFSQATDFKDQGVQTGQVQSVKLRSFMLRVTVPAVGQDLTLLHRVAFFAKADGLPRQRIAHGGPFAAGTTRAELTLDGVELKAFVAAPKMSITWEADGKAPKQDTTLAAKVVLHVAVPTTGVLPGR